MSKKSLLLTAIAVCLMILAAFYLSRPPESPERIAEKFTRDLFKVAPPVLDKTAINSTIGKLSSKAKQQIKSLGDIADFLDVQKLPDRGFEIVGIDKNEGKAQVKMRWDYTGGAVIKKYFMIFENGSWKIDLIKNSKI